MRSERQAALANEFFRMWDGNTTTLADDVHVQPTSIYTDAEHLRAERELIFRGRPLAVGLSGELVEPGDYLCVDVDGLPVVVIRGEDDKLRAMVNMCGHRGARVFQGDRGHVAGRGMACPFHAWSYDIDGRLLGQPLARDGFAQCDADTLSLRPLAVIESHGMVFVVPTADDGSSTTGGTVGDGMIERTVADDLRDLELHTCRYFASSTRTIGINWKLVIDTFLEAYHVFSLHRTTLAPRQFSTPCLFEDHGSIGLVVGIRKTILEEQERPPDERQFVPHATLQYIIYPNVIVSHQIDHIETWRVFPGPTPDEAVVTTTIYSYGDEIDERTEHYLQRSLDVLLSVTDTEDFPQVAVTQQALLAGGKRSFVFGRNEPGLVAYHKWLDAAMEAK